MDANEIRRIIINVNPPKLGEMTVVGELNKEIASVCPFWMPLLKNRDIRSVEGGDQYIQGLIETFARIYDSLKKAGKESILSVIDANALYAVDEAMSSSDLNLGAEYPVLQMLDIEKMGAFGAGIFAAYGLLEMALVSPGRPSAKIAAAEASLDKTGAAIVEPESFEATMESLLGDATPVSRPNAAEPGGRRGPAPAARPKVAAYAPPQEKGMRAPVRGPADPGIEMPILVLNIYDTKNGFKLVGDLAPTLGAAARAHEILVKLFGVDANLVVRGDESRGAADIQVSFAVLEK